jgi:CHAT domain-containing protein
VSFTPSIRALVQQRAPKRASTASRPFLGIGNPVLQGPAGLTSAADLPPLTAGKKLADVNVIRRYGTLPETERELKDLARTFSAPEADLLLGNNATEGRLKSLNLADYRVIAFATHGLLAGRAGVDTEPGLVLTPPDVASIADDGLLTSSEIMALKFDADLIILSACSTAGSDGRPRAEALSGLALSFFSAGARNLLVTHWGIPTVPAVEITTGAARAWMENPSLGWSRALQQTQSRLASQASRPEFAHPASWGAFQFVGATR